MDNTTTKKTGIGFWNALQLALIILKLIGAIEWSWMVVLIPLWVDVLIVVAGVTVYLWALNREINRARKREEAKNED